MSLSWSEAASRLSGNEPPADLVIEDVRVDPGLDPPTGEEVEVEVVARDVSGIQGSVAGYCMVGVSTLDYPDNEVVFHCAIFDGGATFTFDDICSLCRGTESFEMPNQPVDLTVEVGGADRSYDCQAQQNFGIVTDTRTVTLREPSISPSDVVPASCAAPSPGEIAMGEQATVAGNVQNTSQFDAIVTVRFEWLPGQAGEAVATSTVGDVSVPAGQTVAVETPMQPADAGSGPVQMGVLDVREA